MPWNTSINGYTVPLPFTFIDIKDAFQDCVNLVDSMRPDSFLRLWHYINHSLTYLLTYLLEFLIFSGHKLPHINIAERARHDIKTTTSACVLCFKQLCGSGKQTTKSSRSKRFQVIVNGVCRGICQFIVKCSVFWTRSAYCFKR